MLLHGWRPEGSSDLPKFPSSVETWTQTLQTTGWNPEFWTVVVVMLLGPCVFQGVTLSWELFKNGVRKLFLTGSGNTRIIPLEFFYWFYNSQPSIILYRAFLSKLSVIPSLLRPQFSLVLTFYSTYPLWGTGISVQEFSSESHFQDRLSWKSPSKLDCFVFRWLMNCVLLCNSGFLPERKFVDTDTSEKLHWSVFWLSHTALSLLMWTGKRKKVVELK